jgi:hypothetical protein
LAALLEAYLGRRSAARMQAGALRRGTVETIRAVLLSADLRGLHPARCVSDGTSQAGSGLANPTPNPVNVAPRARIGYPRKLGMSKHWERLLRTRYCNASSGHSREN